MRKAKKFLSLLLSAAMLFSFVPSVSASTELNETFDTFSSTWEMSTNASLVGTTANAFTGGLGVGSTGSDTDKCLAYTMASTVSGGRGGAVALPATYSSDYMTISFDWGHYIPQRGGSQLLLGGADNKVLLKLEAYKDTDALRVNDVATAHGVSYLGTAATSWINVVAAVDFNLNVIDVTLTYADGVSETLQVPVYAATTSFSQFGIFFNRGSGVNGLTNIYIDNLKVVYDEIAAYDFAVAALDGDTEVELVGADVSVYAYDNETETVGELITTLETGSDGYAAATLKAGYYAYVIDMDGYFTTYEGDADGESGYTIVDLTSSDYDYSRYLQSKTYDAQPSIVLVGGQNVVKYNETTNSSYSYYVIDQENVTITADCNNVWTTDNEYVYVENNKVCVEEGIVFPEGENTIDVEVTLTSTHKTTGLSDSVSKIVTIYNYEFYEPGVGGSSYGDVNTTTVGGVEYMCTPSTQKTTYTLTLPEPVYFEKGTFYNINYNVCQTKQAAYTFDRHIAFNGDATIAKISYINNDMGLDIAESSSNSTLGTVVGSFSSADMETWANVNIDIKPGAAATKVEISVDGGDVTTITTDATYLSNITLYLGNIVTIDRFVAFKDIVVSTSEAPALMIEGDSYIQAVSTATRTKDYIWSVGVEEVGETFEWSIEDPDGTGATISQDGVLSVPAEACDGVVTLVVTSSAGKSATYDVEVYAAGEMSSATLTAPACMEVGGTATAVISDVIDGYGDEVTEFFTPYFEVDNEEVATVDPDTGVITAVAPGTVTVTAFVGNEGYEYTVEKAINVGYFVLETDDEIIDVADMISYGTTTYNLTTESGVVTQVTAVDGKITNTTGKLVQVTPVYKFSFGADKEGYVTVATSQLYDPAVGYGLSSASSYNNGVLIIDGRRFMIDVPEARYDITIKKGIGKRADMRVNGYIVGQNVDQDGVGRTSSGALFTATDIKINGGSAEVYFDNYNNSEGASIQYMEFVLKSEWEERKPHIYVGGDSTFASYYGISDTDGASASGTMRTGAGQLIEKFASDSLIVTNLAESGNYASSWYASTFPTIPAMAEEGDYFFLEFGINDRSYSDVASMTEAVTAMVQECKEVGVIPVLLTPMICNSQGGVSGDGTGSGNAGFFQVMRDVAAAEGIVCVDLASLTYNYLRNLFPGDVDTAAAWTTANYQVTGDNQHLSYQGAAIVASLLMNNLMEQYEAGEESLAGLLFDKTYSYTFTDTDGVERTLSIEGKSLEAGEFFTDAGDYAVEVTNNTTEDKTVYFYVIGYDEYGRFETVTYEEESYTIPADGETYALYAPVSDSDNLKVIVWDAETMKPLNDVLVVE